MIGELVCKIYVSKLLYRGLRVKLHKDLENCCLNKKNRVANNIKEIVLGGVL